ncbi:hypothetical protein WDZ92_29890, partial [Nostoc sp. NIES-2111]
MAVDATVATANAAMLALLVSRTGDRVVVALAPAAQVDAQPRDRGGDGRATAPEGERVRPSGGLVSEEV